MRLCNDIGWIDFMNITYFIHEMNETPREFVHILPVVHSILHLQFNNSVIHLNIVHVF